MCLTPMLQPTAAVGGKHGKVQSTCVADVKGKTQGQISVPPVPTE